MEFLLGDCWNYWNGHEKFYEEVKKQTKKKKPGSAKTPCRSETQAYVGNRPVFINYMEVVCKPSAIWGWLQSIWVGLWLFGDRLTSHLATCIVTLRLKVVAQRLHAQLLDDKLALLLVTRSLLWCDWDLNDRGPGWHVLSGFFPGYK